MRRTSLFFVRHRNITIKRQTKAASRDRKTTGMPAAGEDTIFFWKSNDFFPRMCPHLTSQEYFVAIPESGEEIRQHRSQSFQLELQNSQSVPVYSYTFSAKQKEQEQEGTLRTDLAGLGFSACAGSKQIKCPRPPSLMGANQS